MPLDIKIDTAKFAEIETFVRDTANAALSGADLKREIGDFAVERLKYQARIGKPFSANGSFPPLKESTIKNRKYLARYNPTHATFDHEFSNVTVTGDLLDSLTWTDIGNCLLRLAFVGEHKAYYGKQGQVISKAIDNQVLSGYLATKGFNIFDVSLKTNSQFVSRIKTICQGFIRRGLRVRNKLASSD